jgi:hypothetical protein
MLEGGTLGMVERREHTILKCCRTAVHRTGSPAKRRGSLVVWNRAATPQSASFRRPLDPLVFN